MDTLTILTLAVVVNVVIALVAVAWPRLTLRLPASLAAASAESAVAGHGAGRPTSRAAAASGATAERDSPRPFDPAAAWFPDWMTASTNGHHVDGQPGAGWTRVEPLKDGATGFDLPPSWSRWIAEEEARVRRFHRPATVVIVEVAGIDRLVERLGLDTAERLIPPIAITMRRHGREVDHFVRLGSSRFGVLLTETNEVAAINYVERIRSACDLWLASGAVALHLAIGWAEINQGQNAAAAIEEAEQRLFADRDRRRGKASGRVRREPMTAKAAAATS
jgi:diguanylate cyclase (GGDEF)-like protein